jgi:hypothetical protein
MGQALLAVALLWNVVYSIAIERGCVTPAVSPAVPLWQAQWPTIIVGPAPFDYLENAWPISSEQRQG